MTFEEAIAKLAELNTDKALIDALKDAHKDFDAKLSKEKEAAKKAKEEAKEAAGKLKAAQARAEKALDAIGIDADTGDDDLDDAITEALKSKTADPALAKRIAKLEKKLTEQDATYKAQISEERGKRFDGMKRAALMEALTKNNADEVEILSDLLSVKMAIDETDESITLDGKDVGEAVKDFLTTHPKFAKDTQTRGAGSLTGGQQGGSNDDPFMAEIRDMAKARADAEKASADNPYFKAV